MSDPLVLLTREDHVATVTLNRGDKLNALTSTMLDQLEAAARGLSLDSGIRTVVLRSASPKAFCVGADVNEWSSLQALDMWRQWVRRGHEVFDQWARLRQPVVVALDGLALGGGLELAILADIRIAGAGARFGLPEASIATCPGWSGTQRMVRLLGASRAKYLALSGRQLEAEEALACGLVHEVVTSGEAHARATSLALAMAHKAPVALQLTKQLVNAAAGEGADAALEAMAGALSATTEDAIEGMASFRARRPANFRGQ
jgi:enoyl-CoA hydratase